MKITSVEKFENVGFIIYSIVAVSFEKMCAREAHSSYSVLFIKVYFYFFLIFSQLPFFFT